MKICSAVPENGCLIVLVDEKKTKKAKKNKKTTAKHIRIRLLPEGGCVNKAAVDVKCEVYFTCIRIYMYDCVCIYLVYTFISCNTVYSILIFNVKNIIILLFEQF